MKKKATKDYYLTTRVDRDTSVFIQAVAATQDRTVSQVVFLLLREAIQARLSKEQAA